MLNLFTQHLQAAANSLSLMRRKPLASLLTILVITIALILPALFWIFTDDLKQITVGWKNNDHISLYLEPSLSKSAAKEMLEKIVKMDGVSRASIKSAEQGLQEIQKQEGMQDIMQYLDSNPLPNVIEVIPDLSVQKIETIYNSLQSLTGVKEAKIDLQWVKRLQIITNFAAKTSHALMLILAFAVILIISHTLKITLHDRQEEIHVLQLLGATDAYIMRPFLYSGIWYGLFGAIFAVLVINIFLLTIASAAKDLLTAYAVRNSFFALSVKQAYSLVFISLGLGWLGARWSVITSTRDSYERI